MKRAFPVDIHGVSRYGIEEWLDSYQTPACGHDFQQIHDAIFTAMLASLGDELESSPAYLAVVSNFRIIYNLAHFLFNARKIDLLGQQGYTHLMGAEDTSLDDERLNVRNHLMMDQREQRLSTIDYLRCHWRKFRTNYKRTSLFAAAFPRSSRSTHFLVGDPATEELRVFCKDNQLRPVALQPRLFLTKNRQQPPRTHVHAVDNFVSATFAGLTEQLPWLGEYLSPTVAEAVARCLHDTLAAIATCKRSLRNWAPSNLLITNLGNAYHRILATAWRENQGKTIGFCHGRPFVLSYKPNHVMTGYHSILDTYVVNSNGEKRLLQAAVKDFNSGFPPYKSIVVNKTNIYQALTASAESGSGEIPRTIKRVMLVGFPMSHHYHAYNPEHHSLSHLYLELNLCRSLKSHGYTIVYKAHPDTLDVIKDVYARFADEIIEEKFELCYGKADCILFGSPATSAFGFALLTRVPIVFVDIKGNYWHPDVRNLLAKRCGIVSADVDPCGRIVFEPDALIDAVKAAPDLRCQDIITEFALT